ncbi:MAG TPA: redoxin domain-containing protein [Bacteroidota bacterium]|jgi:tetratricopeptide (TPR) repeat protein
MSIRIVFLSIALFLFFTAKQYSFTDEQAVSHYKKGIELLNQSDWNNAGQEFKKAISIDPLFLDAHEKYQDVEYFYFEHKEAVLGEYHKLVETHPQASLYHYLLSLIIEAKEKRQEELEKAISIDPTFVRAYNSLIGLFMYNKEYADAESLLTIGLQHLPNSIDLLLEKQGLLEAIGKTDQRNELLHYLVEHYPDSVHVSVAYYNLALLTADEGEKIKLFEDAYRMNDPSYVPQFAITTQLFSLYARRDSARAVNFARNAIRSSAPIDDRRAPSQAWQDLYRFYISRKDTVEAIKVAREVGKSNSPDPDLFDYFAKRLISMDKETPLAFEYFKKAISLNTPQNMFGYHAFGKTSETTLNGLSKSMAAKYRGDCGKAHFKLGNYKKAIEEFQAAMGKAEWAEADIRFQLGKTYERLGKPKDAISAYTSSLSIKEDPEVRSAVESLAGRESNLRVAIPEKRIVNIDSAISAAQLRTAKEANNFTLPDLKGINHSLKDYRGKMVVLDFWATWCGPCVAELPHLQKLADSLKNDPDIVFLAVSTDLDSSVVREFLDKNKYTLTVLCNIIDISTMYNVEGIPTLFIIDQNGKIRYKHVGFDPNVNFEGMISKEIGLVLRSQ